ncbi:MAG: CrcB family protein [Myxococcota bacterium]
MILDVVAVAAGGAVGALLRFAAIRRAEARTGAAARPWDRVARATLGANVGGCLLLGVWVAAAGAGRIAGDWPPAAANALDLFVLTGVCGGWTTFSTIVADGARLRAERGPASALGYAAATLAAGILALWLGLRLGT